ncbi:hypothetical protein D3C86_2007960 [compost metagenome]
MYRLGIGGIHIVYEKAVNDDLAVFLIGGIESAQFQKLVPGNIFAGNIAEAGSKMPINIGVGAVFLTDIC